jgi:lipoprotein-releasing system permease protein
MIPLALEIALSHLRTRRRQTLVSVMGVALGVGFFIAISGMMHGFQGYFLSQIVESNPHVVISDEFRMPAPQPLRLLHPDDAVAISRILPRDPVRGIADSQAILAGLALLPGVAAAPTLRGQVLLRRAGRDFAVTALGIDPPREALVTSVARDMVEGSLPSLAAMPDGIILGAGLATKMGAAVGDALAAATPQGGNTRLRVVGIFKSGLESLDNSQVFVTLAKQQSMQGRPRVVNEIRIRLAEVAQSIPAARMIEGRWGYKTAPWEETNSRVLAVFLLQNWIMFATTGAILVVAGFGIFNIISTVVLEKSRDIAIMRSIGMAGADITRIFVIEGVIVGGIGMVAGWALGWAMAAGLGLLPAPGAADPNQTLRIAQSPALYGLASLIAVGAAVIAAWLPARKAARTDPLEVIRGAS